MSLPENRPYAKTVADWCARSLAEAKDTGAFDTRCFVQNADLIIAALREYAGQKVVMTWKEADDGIIMQDRKTA